MGPAAHSLAALGALAAIPVGVAALALRPQWRPGLRERLGWHPAGPAHPVWVHAASVGEARVASRLVQGLRAEDEAVVASTMTVTGRDMLQSLVPDLSVGLAPLDHPWSVAKALRRVSPRALVFVETELWPSWLAGARARGVPCAVVSGRISDRSLPRYRRFARLLHPALAGLSLVGARSEQDAERFAMLGVPEAVLSVTGDLKLEPPEPVEPPADLAAVAGAAPWLVAGSTHAGEEEALLDAQAALEGVGLRTALVLAPRHPERFDGVAALVGASGRVLRRRSRLGAAPLAAGEVLLLDSLGELAAVYQLGAAAFVGGTLVPVGGHNVLEPVFAGCPVLFGPNTDNGREAAELLLGCGAAQRVAGAPGLAAAAEALFREPSAADARNEAARATLAAHRGAAVRTVAAIRSLLGASP